MNYNLKTFFLVIASIVFLFLIGCDNAPSVKQKSVPAVVSGKIKTPSVSPTDKKSLKDKKQDSLGNEPSNQAMTGLNEIDVQIDSEKLEHYDFQGKIDPFKPLIQEKPDPPENIADKKPTRILTPLEKIDLGQIRLVAVIIMEKKQIAMVEEASGKGYEVGLGTYIGKKQGRVTEIKNSSIVITELNRDFKGRLTEHIQEIKLHKNDNGE